MAEGDFDVSRSLEIRKFKQFTGGESLTQALEIEDPFFGDSIDEPDLKKWPSLAFEETKGGFSYFSRKRTIKAPAEPQQCTTRNHGFSKPMMKRGCYSKGGQFEWAEKLLKEGRGNRDIARTTGAHAHTVARYRKICEALNGAPFMCKCGAPATHQGWCSVRFAKSEARIDFIAKWAVPGKRKKPA